MTELNFNLVPGMTEPAEQKMLYELARIIKLKDDDVIYEFGPFFGRSTYYLAKGLENNANKQKSNTIHTYDMFQCPIDNNLAPHIYKHARAASVTNLLEEVNGNLRFIKVFEHYLQEFISTGIVKCHTKSLEESYPEKGNIALIHIDSPKRYEDFKYILFRFFPLLRKGSIVIFQDYFYHWSGSLVSAVQLLSEMGILKLSFSAATSLVTEVLEQPDLKLLSELALKLNDKDMPVIIDRAINAISSIKIDRRDHFQPRLNLAKIQLLMASGNYSKASQEINILLNANKMNLSHHFHLSELIGQNFSNS